MLLHQVHPALLADPRSPAPPVSQTVGEVKSGRFQYAMEHLSCFAGAMLGLGSQVLDYRKKDLHSAKLISNTCYYIGASTASGLQPERVDFFEPVRRAARPTRAAAGLSH